MKAPKQIRTALLTVGLFTLASVTAHAACAKADNFSFKYPAYSATWSQDDCEAYAASGIGHCYIFGGDAGWTGAQEGVDCSAFCSRVWAIPGYIAKNVTGAHPYSTYSWYPNDGSIPTPPAHTHFVTVNSINDIQPYDCFVLNANFGNLGIHHMGLIESIDYAGGIIYTREANCSTQPTSGCDGPDGIHDNSWTYSSLVVNGLARIIRRNDWGPTTNRCTVGPIASNPNGALQMFGVGSDTAVWQDLQAGPNSSWNGWASFGQTGSIPGCAVSHDLDGRLEVFCVGSSHNVMRKSQTSPGSGWTSWSSLGGNGFTNLQAIANADGRVELFGIGTNGDIWHVWESAANGGFYSTWFDRTGKKIKPGYAVQINADGRLELFGGASDGHIWHNYQTNAGGGWKGWLDLGVAGTSMNGDVAAARDRDGRLEVFAIGSNGDLWVNFQTTAGGSYYGWVDLGGNGIKAGFVVGVNATGRLELFGVRGNNNLWHSAQITPGGSWQAWRDLGSTGIDPQLVVASNADGRLEVFGVGSGNNIVSNFQNSPGATWFGWIDMSGVGTKFYYGQ